MPIHVHHLEAEAIPAEVLAGAGHTSEAMQQEARQGVETAGFLARQLISLQQLLERLERQHAIDQPGAVLTALDRRLLRLFCAGQVTDDRLHQVGEGHQTLDASVFIGDQGDLDAVLAELADHRQGSSRLRDVKRFLEQGAHLDRALLQTGGQQRMAAHDPNAVIEAAAAHRQARVAGREHLGQLAVERLLQIQPPDLGARRHDRAHGPVGQMEHPLHQLMFRLLEHA